MLQPLLITSIMNHLNTPLLVRKARKAVPDRKCIEVCSGRVLGFTMLVLTVRRNRVTFEKFKLTTDSG